MGAHVPLSLTLILGKGNGAGAWQSGDVAPSGPPGFPSGASSHPLSSPLASRWATVSFRAGRGETQDRTALQHFSPRAHLTGLLLCARHQGEGKKWSTGPVMLAKENK